MTLARYGIAPAEYERAMDDAPQLELTREDIELLILDYLLGEVCACCEDATPYDGWLCLSCLRAVPA